MSSGRKRDDQVSDQRRKAESILRNRIAMPGAHTAASNRRDALRALHELSVHQIELEMQKEELHRALEELERLNHLYAALSQVNQSIIRSSTETELLDRICKVMVVSGKFDLAWIGWRDPDTGGMRVASLSGDGAGDLSGFGSSVAAPLRKACGVQGILSVHARGPDRFGEQERALLEEAAEGVSFALDHLELDAQRRTAEEALAASAAKARSMLRTARDGVWLTDAAGRFLEVNEAACRMLGYTHDEMCALSVSDVEGGESREAVLRHIEKLHREGADLFESVHLRKDGIRIPVEVSVTDLPDQSCTVAYVRDITERKASYARLSEANARLRSLTLELTRTEQRERHRLAQVLHDHLQQELVGATFSLETLEGQTRARAALKTLGHLSETIHRAIDISRDLTVELSPPVFHEKGLGGGLEWLARQALKNHGLQVAAELEGNLEPDTEAVRMFIFEAVRELLLNVVKHAKVERARIRMRPHGDGEIAITVEDDGAGFDPSRLEAEASATGGMGLFSIRERLRFLQGGMEITSRPGCGSSLTLVIPVHARPEGRDRAEGKLTWAADGGLRDDDQDPHRR